MITLLNREMRHMQVDGFESLTVIESDGAATQIERSYDLHVTRSHSMDGAIGRGTLIDASVEISSCLSVVQALNTEG
jgi:hypothetical protein